MKKLIGVLFVMALSGCNTTQSHRSQMNSEPLPATAPASERVAQIKQRCESQNHFEGDKREVNLWLCESVSAIQSQFYDVDAYKGRYCDIMIKQPEGQMPVDIKAQGGNPGLCTAAINVIKETIKAGIFPTRPKVLGDEIKFRFQPQ